MTENKNLPEVEIYSDGGANPNPGPGGYGIIMGYKGIKKEFKQGFKKTTNNRMELTGVITALEKLKTKSKVHIFTDSQYTINGIEKGWAEKWKANNWYRTKSQKAINYDLWEKLLKLIEKHEVKFTWVKGHDGHTENERCDELATQAMSMDNLLDDEGFNDVQQQILISDDKNTKDIKIDPAIAKRNKDMKVENVGDLCKKCESLVEKRFPKHTKKTLQKQYYYEYYLYCPNCKTMYMVPEAKRDIKDLKI